MPGRLDRKRLAQLIEKGEIDTVLTVFPDAFGRLMGKRVVGRYFLDHVIDDGAHACIYLFTVDMEMEPLPGFKLTSWERGYGDMKMVPDLATARIIPWLPKTLREAIAELERSKVARSAFGERVVEHYLHTARLEQQAFDQVVTDWELARNFERI